MSFNDRIPFGKHKGKDLLFIAEYDVMYLVWLSQLPDLKEPLRTSVVDFVNSNYVKDCIEEYNDCRDQFYDALCGYPDY